VIRDHGWCWPQDKLSVHVGINYRFWLCRQRRERPVRILLGRMATRQYMREKGWIVIPRGQHYYGRGEWRCPIVFNAKGYGPWAIVVETRPLPPKEKRRKGG